MVLNERKSVPLISSLRRLRERDKTQRIILPTGEEEPIYLHFFSLKN